MGLMMVWGFIILLLFAVLFLFWFLFKNNQPTDTAKDIVRLEEKVLHLELHLKKGLEIMQDMAKKMHVQQEVLDKTIANVAALEKQNAELVGVLEIVVKGTKGKS